MGSTVVILSMALLALSVIVDVIVTTQKNIRIRNIVRARYGLWMVLIENIPQISFAISVLLRDTFSTWAYVTIVVSVIASISRVVLALSIMIESDTSVTLDAGDITITTSLESISDVQETSSSYYVVPSNTPLSDNTSASARVSETDTLSKKINFPVPPQTPPAEKIFE